MIQQPGCLWRSWGGFQMRGILTFLLMAERPNHVPGEAMRPPLARLAQAAQRAVPLLVVVLAVLASEAGAQCEVDKLTPSDAAGADEFGTSVSISGDTALVGAHRDDDAGSSSGSAYVFEKQRSAVWVEVATEAHRLRRRGR